MVESNINKGINIKKNYILNTILQVALLLVPLITIPYVSRVLGSDGVGKYSFNMAIVTYFVIFAILGTSTYGQRQIAYVRNDKKKLTENFWNIFVLRVLTSTISIFFYIAYLLIAKEVDIICSIMVLQIINVKFDITWFFQGIEKFSSIVYKTLFFKILNLALIFAFVKNENDLWIYVLIMCGTTALSSVSMWLSLKKNLVWEKIKLHPFSNIKDVFLIFLPTIAIQVYTILDKTMIGWITGSNYENACYDRAEQIARVALTVVTSIAAVILPRISNLYNNGYVEQAKKYLYKAYHFVWLLSIPITLGLIVCSSTFIPLFLGEGYEESVDLLRVFSLLVIFVSASYVTGLSYLVSTKQQNVYTFAVTVSAFLNLILNLILIPKFNAMGAAISSVVAEFVGCLFQIMYCLLKRQLKFSKVFYSVWKYLFAGLCMFIITFLISKVDINSVPKLLIIMVSGIMIYFSILLILHDKVVIDEIHSVVTKLFKRSKLINVKEKVTNCDNMKVLVTGVAGQLGYDVINELNKRGIIAIGTDIRKEDELVNIAKWNEYVQLDITNKEQVDTIVSNIKPDAIIHCAAWTNVDGAEDENNKPIVKKVNAEGTDNLVKVAKKLNCKLLYISTDYVFDGEGARPWQPDDKNYAPQNYYGETKLQGELAVSSQLDKYFIVRIAWVFGLNGKNFIKTMLMLADKGYKELRVVDDQIGTPTYTYDVARLLVDMIQTEKYGYYHATNEGGYISWADFAEEIFRQANKNVKVIRVTTAEYGSSVAKRPFNSRLDKSKLVENGFTLLPDWKDAITRYLFK